MRNNMFTVHELTQITGLSRRTIHFYDKIGLLKATQVQENGYRLYSLATVETLKWILFLKDLDLSLQEISNILSMPKKEQMLELAQYQVVLDSKIQQLQHTQRNLSRFLSGEDIFELDFVKKSKTVPLKEQFFKEAKIVYGTTDVFKTFESQMLQLTDEKKKWFSLNLKRHLCNSLSILQNIFMKTLLAPPFRTSSRHSTTYFYRSCPVIMIFSYVLPNSINKIKDTKLISQNCLQKTYLILFIGQHNFIALSTRATKYCQPTKTGHTLYQNPTHIQCPMLYLLRLPCQSSRQ